MTHATYIFVTIAYATKKQINAGSSLMCNTWLEECLIRYGRRKIEGN